MRSFLLDKEGREHWCFCVVDGGFGFVDGRFGAIDGGFGFVNSGFGVVDGEFWVCLCFFFLPLMFWVCMCFEFVCVLRFCPTVLGWFVCFFCFCFFYADLYIFLDLWVGFPSGFNVDCVGIFCAEIDFEWVSQLGLS